LEWERGYFCRLIALMIYFGIFIGEIFDEFVKINF
jgi:hypothetical protein